MKTTLCYIERDGKYLMLYRNKKENDAAEGKYIGIGGKFLEGETPDECLLREALEETGFRLTDYQYRGIVYFVSDRWENEDMHLYTATGFTFPDGSDVPVGYLPECDEGTFSWVPVDEIDDLPMWEGDRCFFSEIAAGSTAIDMTLTYEGDDLVSVENRTGIQREDVSVSGRMHVEHALDPIFDERSEVLVLGTMPSPLSREVGFYYGNPRNRFWPVLAQVFTEPTPLTNDERRDFLLRHHIALWDVLASCDIKGASDASIANAVPNDLSRITHAAPIRAVFCTGAKAADLYAKHCEAKTGISACRLPSPSPANAAKGFEQLCEAYAAIADEVHLPATPILDVPDVVRLEQAIAARGTSLLTLMQRAGRSLAYHAERIGLAALQGEGSADAGASRRPLRVSIVCGFGNNGGDGWVAAGELASHGFDVRLVTPVAAGDLRAEPAATAAAEVAARLPEDAIVVAPAHETLAALLAQSDVVVDAMLGTGFSRSELRQPFKDWACAINAVRAKGAVVVAADVPSGVSAQTGVAVPDAVEADCTVTMIALKPGILAAGRARCGDVVVAPLCDSAPIIRELGLS